ncbi:MAG: DUF5309 family protein [Caldilineaceae bacterium]
MAIGARTTYTDTTNQKRSISDMINYIDPSDAGLLQRFGIANQGRFRLLNWPSTKYEWLEDAASSTATTLAEQADIAETELDLTDGSLFKEGDILLCGTELMYVSGVATNTVTVVRGFGGTTDALHLNGAAIEMVTIARLEGADWDVDHTTVTSAPYNYTQIFSGAATVTGSEEVMSKYGYNDTMAYHLAKLMGGSNGQGTRFRAGKLPIALQKTFYYGKRAVGSSSTSRAMGGFEQFVTTNVTDLSSAALLRKNIEDLLQRCSQAGGLPDTLICNAWPKRKISSMFEGTISTQRTETTGGSVINRIITDFGELDVVYDRLCPTDRLYVVDSAKLGWVEYRPFKVVDVTTSGDYTEKAIVGEYGFVVTNESAHGYIKGISTTS